jgi:hypothetical protein
MFSSLSNLKKPLRLPCTLKYAEGFPMMITESTWVNPTLYQSEGPIMLAAYGALTGLDAFYWFAFSSMNYDNGLGKWSSAHPETAGMMPAGALIFRKLYIKPAPVILMEERSMDSLYKRLSPLIGENYGFDPNRDKENADLEANIKGGVNPLALLVGSVRVKYNGNAANTKLTDVSEYIDEKKQTVRSITDELDLDYGNGILKLNAPKAQGVSGFLSKIGKIKLSDISIQSGNDYATIVVVPMDDSSIKESKKLLIEVGTYCRPTGWKTIPSKIKSSKTATDTFIDAEEILNVGSQPYKIKNTDATIIIRNGKLSKAQMLDEFGFAGKNLEVKKEGNELTIKLPPRSMYVVVQ